MVAGASDAGAARRARPVRRRRRSDAVAAVRRRVHPRRRPGRAGRAGRRRRGLGARRDDDVRGHDGGRPVRVRHALARAVPRPRASHRLRRVPRRRRFRSRPSGAHPRRSRCVTLRRAGVPVLAAGVGAGALEPPAESPAPADDEPPTRRRRPAPTTITAKPPGGCAMRAAASSRTSRCRTTCSSTTTPAGSRARLRRSMSSAARSASPAARSRPISSPTRRSPVRSTC